MARKRSDQGVKRRYTIRDIAEMAGVSRSTVSLALNDSDKINAKTKERVLEIVRKVGYHPSAIARSLVRQKAGVVCVILPQIDHVVSDFYFSESLSGILEVVTRKGYHLMVEMATPEFKEQRKALSLYRQRAMDGVLCVGNLTTDTYLSDLAEAGCPVVLVNSSLPNLHQVLGANREAAYRAVAHLHSLGHTRIGHIRGSEFVTTAIHRTEGYLRAVRELGLEESDELLAQGYFDQRSGYLATKWLLSHKRRPTAIYSVNDMMAIGAMQAIREAGLRIPQDIALFGGDDILLAQYVTPKLSTIRQNMYSIGQLACEQLFRILEGKPATLVAEVELELVIRESCGAALVAKNAR
ncbi:MAG: LacI family transcriptional regulator [Candidatus Sumerlaea sp.]|nr:LacI family transcriptional regulator [Candidatus Sumerlaea chitinivorans]GIX44183.1 MAG: LacI family transcriptional regulator [Candidatus Sumerlaea sp.]